LVRQAAPESDPGYGAYIAAMECWFRAPWMKELDEAGIPLPLAERLAPFVGDALGRAEALEAIRNLGPDDSDALDAVDRFILDLALSAG
jgi:hypothetical protein